ncbi:MAG TPA: hypothetical protein VE871_11795 [Longimicrobium sp.]|nr:hypothetical protein [Longimicrobium sp.]
MSWSGSQPIQSNTGSERINNKLWKLAECAPSGNPRRASLWRRKEFDAVAMTRHIPEGHAEQLKNASVEERVAFYREKARQLHEQLATERAQTVP